MNTSIVIDGWIVLALDIIMATRSPINRYTFTLYPPPHMAYIVNFPPPHMSPINRYTSEKNTNIVK